MILPPDAEYLTLAFHMEALKDPGIFSAQSPCLSSVQEGEENKCFVCLDFDGQ